VVCRCDSAHFVTIHCIVEEETLDLFRYLERWKVTPQDTQLAKPDRR
jgi:hypothetical protein